MRNNLRLLMAILILLICVSTAGCTNKEKYDYLSKNIISLQDVEKLFKDEGIKLVKQGNDKAEFDTLQQKHSTRYLINSDPQNVLNVYIFSSEDERKKARLEYNKKTDIANASMAYHEIYEAKNIMVILAAGDNTNSYYSKAASAIEKINTRSKDKIAFKDDYIIRNLEV